MCDCKGGPCDCSSSCGPGLLELWLFSKLLAPKPAPPPLPAPIPWNGLGYQYKPAKEPMRLSRNLCALLLLLLVIVAAYIVAAPVKPAASGSSSVYDGLVAIRPLTVVPRSPSRAKPHLRAFKNSNGHRPSISVKSLPSP